MNTNKLKDFISWLIQISFEGYSKEKQIERLMAVCVDMRINHEAFKTLVKVVNDCSAPASVAIEELAQNIEKWTKVYTQRYLSRMISDAILDQQSNGKAEEFINIWHEADAGACHNLNLLQTAYSNMWLRQKFIRWLIGNGYGIVELRDLRYIDIAANSLTLNSHSGEIPHSPLIDIDSYLINHGSPHKDATILRWIEKYPKYDSDRYQKAISDWADGLHNWINGETTSPQIPGYELKLPNHGVSGSFVSMKDIEAEQRETNEYLAAISLLNRSRPLNKIVVDKIRDQQHEFAQKGPVLFFDPKHHEPIGSRQMHHNNERVIRSWSETVNGFQDLRNNIRDLWNKIREAADDSNSKAYLKKNQRGKPIIAKKKNKPSGLLKALVAKKD